MYQCHILGRQREGHCPLLRLIEAGVQGLPGWRRADAAWGAAPKQHIHQGGCQPALPLPHQALQRKGMDSKRRRAAAAQQRIVNRSRPLQQQQATQGHGAAVAALQWCAAQHAP